MFAAKRLFSLVLLGVLLTPPHGAWSRGLLGSKYGAQRLRASCRRSSESADHPFCVPGARRFPPVTEEVIDAARFVSAPMAEVPPGAGAASDAARGSAQAVLSETESTPITQAADPFDSDDSKVKKGRRKLVAESNVTATRVPLKIEPTPDLLTAVRIQLAPRLPRLRETAVPLPHFGSGPCHSIPRPREGTIAPSLPADSAVV